MALPLRIRTLQNTAASLSLALNGGAICDFHLERGPKVNPLSFAFKKTDMPLNNRGGTPYRGHFLCLGRWGEPSEGEQKAGLPNHGQAANLPWKELPSADNRTLDMEVDCPLEGLQASRRLRLDSRNAVFAVEETIRNTAPLGRLYNMVQHPTLAAPFLDGPVVISCNGTRGFNQFEYEFPEQDALWWPNGRYKALGLLKINLDRPSQPCNSVFSFVVNREHPYGWITAWSVRHRLLLGYVWKREDYPWIHLWQDWERERLRYLGIEFGTAALHLPFPQLLNTGLRLFGEQSTAYIDAGKKDDRSYLSFLCEAGQAPESGTGLELEDGGGRIVLYQGSSKAIIETDFNDFI